MDVAIQEWSPTQPSQLMLATQSENQKRRPRPEAHQNNFLAAQCPIHENMMNRGFVSVEAARDTGDEADFG